MRHPFQYTRDAPAGVPAINLARVVRLCLRLKLIEIFHQRFSLRL